MSIDEEGFISPDIQDWINKHRNENSDWFRLAENMNRIGQQQLALLEIPTDNAKSFLIAMLFIRGLSGFQATVILTERGMTTEARTLCRGCFETAFYIGALIKDPEFVSAMIDDDTSRRKKLANGLLNLQSNPDSLDAALLEQFVNNLLQSNFKSSTVQIEDAARRGGLIDIYNVFYRSLSNDSAHPSVTALTRHMGFDETDAINNELPWGPNVSDVLDTISTACSAMVHLIYLAKETISNEAWTRISVQMEDCWKEYKRLTAE